MCHTITLYYVASTSWSDIFPEAHVSRQISSRSGHYPLLFCLVTADVNNNKGQALRYEIIMWVTEGDLQKR
jgi:hypothetical protein